MPDKIRSPLMSTYSLWAAPPAEQVYQVNGKKFTKIEHEILMIKASNTRMSGLRNYKIIPQN